MNFKRINQFAFGLILICITGCLYPDLEWEDLESDYDHVLNVFGLINIDEGSPSYIGLYRTTDLDEASQNLSYVDTLYWCDCDNDDCWECEDNLQDGYWVVDSIYQPAALIKDASVSLIDDQGNSYEFSYIDKITFIDTIYFDTTFTFYGTTINWDTTIYDTNNIHINFYVDTTGTFIPQPEKNYNLSISAAGYDAVSGSLTTPAYPVLDSLSMQGRSVDTVIVNEPFDIHWTQTMGMAMVTGEVVFGNWWEDTSITNWCGGYFDPFIIDLEDDSENSRSIFSEFCEQALEEVETKDYLIRLTAMDDNYYEYFVTGEMGEYSNALLNYPTTKGRSIGIEGGFGFFGSIASDNLRLKIRR